MKNDKERMERIESALLASRAPAAPGNDPAWQAGVMRDVRRAASEGPAADTLALLDSVVWRAAPALAILACVLLVYSVHSGLYPDRMAQAFFCDPADLLAVQFAF
jgi:hypothetical protein